MAKRKTVHLIANSHIDPVWLWRWQEGYGEAIHTCRYLVKLLKEHPDLTFTRSCARIYSWIAEADPKLFYEITQLIRKKRWFVSGPWWVQADCHHPSGESFARHCLYGKGYFREQFGIDVKVGYNPDAFGHNANLPQILKKAGIEFYVFCRPDKGEKRLPQLFRWEGLDGSQVLCCRPPTHYCTINHDIEAKIKECTDNFPEESDHVMCLFGVGNHGGGPTKKSLKYIEEMRKKRPDISFEYSDLERYFKKALKENKDFPIIKEGLFHFARGCYTSFAPIKRLNRIAENKILTAEILSTIVKGNSGGNNTTEIKDIWKDILFNQFHDILPGTSIREAYTDSMGMLGGAIFRSDRIINEKLWQLSREIKTNRVEGFPILFFNPTGFERREVREISFQPRYNFIEAKEADFFDEKGKRVASQGITDANSLRRRFLVDLKLPALGHRVYWWRPGKKRKNKRLVLRGNSLENRYLKVRIDPGTGGIKSLKLKKENWEATGSAGAGFNIIDDEGNAWGHHIESFNKVPGRFQCEKLIHGEQGECCVSLRVKLVFRNSEIFLEYRVYDEQAFVELRGKINWQEKNRMLKFAFPVKVREPRGICEIAYGFMERDTQGIENPCQRWVDVTGSWKGKPYGVSIINDSWYGCDIAGSQINMSMLRSPVFGSFKKPGDLDPKEFYDHHCQGENFFRCYILPHKGGWKGINTQKYACFLNQPLEYILPVSSGGGRSPVQSFIRVHPENLVVTAVKKAERGNCMIIRLYESKGRNTEGKLTVFGKSHPIHVKKFEIKTYAFCEKKGERYLKEVNLLEKEV